MSEQKIPRCTATVWRREQYRYTGRSKSGFEMHYESHQCGNRAIAGGRCRRHPRGYGFSDYRDAKEFKD